MICITHLAQIAAMADTHYLIEKRVEDQMTKTKIRQLDGEESVQELGRSLEAQRLRMWCWKTHGRENSGIRFEKIRLSTY